MSICDTVTVLEPEGRRVLAIMSVTKNFLRDEPTMGQAPILVDEVFGIIVRFERAGYDHVAGRAVSCGCPGGG